METPTPQEQAKYLFEFCEHYGDFWLNDLVAVRLSEYGSEIEEPKRVIIPISGKAYRKLKQVPEEVGARYLRLLFTTLKGKL